MSFLVDTFNWVQRNISNADRIQLKVMEPYGSLNNPMEVIRNRNSKKSFIRPKQLIWNGGTHRQTYTQTHTDRPSCWVALCETNKYSGQYLPILHIHVCVHVLQSHLHYSGVCGSHLRHSGVWDSHPGSRYLYHRLLCPHITTQIFGVSENVNIESMFIHVYQKYMCPLKRHNASHVKQNKVLCSTKYVC